MINSNDIQKYLKVDSTQAYKLASEINLLAGKYDIDSQAIIQLFEKSPADLAKQIDHIQNQRQDLKIRLQKTISPND
jgi:hypothetical protein